MGFSEYLRQLGAEIWASEQNHPFVTGIGDGSLPLDNFRYYMRQDYVFLVEYCRVLSLAVAKSPSLDDMAWFAKLLHETLNTEMELHASYCADFGISRDELEATVPSPTTHAYTRHLIQNAFSNPVGEIAASLLPCAWGYCEIGQMLADRGEPSPEPLYQRWIDAYSSIEFVELAEWVRSFLDRIGRDASDSERKRMEDVFMTSSRHEYMFWDAAYRLEEWPV